MPFLFVLPVAASVYIVAISRSNCSAGVTVQTKRTSLAPAFQNLCASPGSTTTVSPARSSSFSLPRRTRSVPASTSNRSVWNGCTWAAATNPPGCTIVSNTTRSPFVSAAVSWKTSRSPVTGFSIWSPAWNISLPPPRVTDTKSFLPSGGDYVGRKRDSHSAARAIRGSSLRGRSAGLHDAGLVREDDGLHAVAETELHQHVRDMCLHRRLADEELLRDLGVREPACDQLQHLELPRRQLAESRRRRRRRAPGAHELLDQAPRDGRREQRVAVRDRPNAVDEPLGRDVLQQEAARARSQRVEDVLVHVEGRHHHDLRLACAAVREQAPRRLDAVELGHAHVHQHDVRLEPPRLGDRLDAVGRLADNVDVLLG